MKKLIAKVSPIILLGVHLFAQTNTTTSLQASSPAAHKPRINSVFMALTRPRTFESINAILTPNFNLKKSIVPMNNQQSDAFFNPFLTSATDFYTGDSLPWPVLQDPDKALAQYKENIPVYPDRSLEWFEKENILKNNPDIFLVGGHNVIALGYHDHSEQHHMFMPSLIKASQTKQVKEYFAKVKLAVLWGCNTLTVLEPRIQTENLDLAGRLINQHDLRNMYVTAKSVVTGTKTLENSLEFYKNRLAVAYGPGSGHFAYTRNQEQESCKQFTTPFKYEACGVSNVERIMPNVGLLDGSRRFNNAIQSKILFPNAYLVLGYSSASPSEEDRVVIFDMAVKKATAELAKMGYKKNVIEMIIDDRSTEKERTDAIKAMRNNWIIGNYKGRERLLGSITPKFPQIDQNHVVPVEHIEQLKKTNLPEFKKRIQFYGEYDSTEYN